MRFSGPFRIWRALCFHRTLLDICIDAMELEGATHVDRVPSAPDLEMFDYQHEKQRKICYMPRKRRFEVGLIDQALHARPYRGL